MSCPSLDTLPSFSPDKIGWPWTENSQILSETLPIGFPWPRISVVTPSYNQGQFIEETIRSILLQGYPNLEYIVIDGGSTDGSIEIIKKYEPWLAYWVSESDRGQSHAINKGFNIATGDILSWLNSDDIYLPNGLFNVAKAFLRNKAEWIVGNTLITDINLKVLDRFVPQVNTGNWKVKNYKTHGWLDFVITHQSGTALPQTSSFWRKNAISKVGGIDESFLYAMDHELFGRLAHSGFRPNLIPQDIACFRIHGQQKTRNFPIPFWKEELRSVKQWQNQNLMIDEMKALNDYQIWFSRKIHLERVITGSGLKKLFAFGWEKARNIKKGLRKIKRFLIKRYKSIIVPEKGVVPKEVIAQYIPRDPIIIEAGAHIGLDTMELAKCFPEGKIYAFEPVPDLYLQLIERMRPYKNVQCIQLALSNLVGDSTMFISSGGSDGSSSLLPPKDHLIDHPKVIFNETIHVACTTLDYWAQTNNIEKVDLLWLDMQGFELNALKAGSTVLEKVQAIYTEVNIKEVYKGAPLYSELHEWLEAHNFKVEKEEIPWEDSGNVLFIKNKSSISSTQNSV